MKRMLILSQFLLFACVASAQTVVAPPGALPQSPGNTSAVAPPKPLPPPRLPEAVHSTVIPDVTRYLNSSGLLNFCTTQVAEFNDREADVMFVGDSITQNWRGPGKDVWNKYFVPRNAIDFGVSGDQTQHVLWRLDNYPIGRLRVKVAVILIGTNNTRSTAPEIAAGVLAVINRLQILYPGIKIILNSIMPNARANDLMMTTNALIRTYADNKKVYYLDLVPLMTPVDNNWKGLSADKLHPDAAGYEMWADALLPLLDSLLPPPAGAPTASQQ